MFMQGVKATLGIHKEVNKPLVYILVKPLTLIENSTLTYVGLLCSSHP